MTAAELVQQRLYKIWHIYQHELKRVVALLTDEQLKLRVVPHQNSLGEIASHIVFGRALWTLKVLDEPDAGLEKLLAWETPGDNPPPATEIAQGLDYTWHWYTTLINRWANLSPDAAISEQEAEKIQTVWGMLDHEILHAGELSFCLGCFGLETPDF